MKKLVKRVGGKILSIIYRPILSRLDNIKQELNNTKRELREHVDNTKQELNNTKRELREHIDYTKQELIKANTDQMNRALKVLMSAILYKDKDKIFFLDTPSYGNLGDHAIAMGATKILQDLFPSHQIIEFSHFDWNFVKSHIVEFISDKDIIFIHGGGNFGTLYLDAEEHRRSIVQYFPNNKIINMPQSITYLEKDFAERQISQDIYAQHSDFTIIARDEKSLETAQTLFPNNKLELSPDSALYLETEYTMKFQQNKREGVLFVLREDKEKIRSDKKIEEMQNQLKELKIHYDITDTVNVDARFLKEDRSTEVEKKLTQMSQARLIVTDRYHGLIFSVITGTPCIAFKSLDHKISEGFKWVKHLDWVFFADSESDLMPMIQKYVIDNQQINHPKTFKEKIYNFYKNILEK